MMIKKLALFIALLLFGFTPNDFIQSLQDKFNSINDLQADFVQHIKSGLDADKFKIEGKFYYKKGDRYKIEIKHKYIISNGTTLWNYDSNLNRVVISDANDDLNTFSLNKFVNEYPVQCTVLNIDSWQGYNGIKLVPNQNLGFSEVQLFAGDDNILKRIVIKDFTNTEYDIRLSNVEINSGLSEDLFDFSPTNGTEIIDLR